MTREASVVCKDDDEIHPNEKGILVTLSSQMVKLAEIVGSVRGRVYMLTEEVFRVCQLLPST